MCSATAGVWCWSAPIPGAHLQQLHSAGFAWHLQQEAEQANVRRMLQSMHADHVQCHGSNDQIHSVQHASHIGLFCFLLEMQQASGVGLLVFTFRKFRAVAQCRVCLASPAGIGTGQDEIYAGAGPLLMQLLQLHCPSLALQHAACIWSQSVLIPVEKANRTQWHRPGFNLLLQQGAKQTKMRCMLSAIDLLMCSCQCSSVSARIPAVEVKCTQLHGPEFALRLQQEVEQTKMTFMLEQNHC